MGLRYSLAFNNTFVLSERVLKLFDFCLKMPSQYNITIQKPNGESSPPHTIKEGETLEVGRKQRKDDEIPGQLKLDSKVVSRKHAEFRVENGKVCKNN